MLRTGSLDGAFSNLILPALAQGLAWATSGLTSLGDLYVVPGPRSSHCSARASWRPGCERACGRGRARSPRELALVSWERANETPAP